MEAHPITSLATAALYKRALITFNKSTAYLLALDQRQHKKDIQTGNARFGHCAHCSHSRDGPAVPRKPDVTEKEEQEEEEENSDMVSADNSDNESAAEY